MRTLVLGGIRSGKSKWAETAVAESLAPGETVRYLATGPAPDTDGHWSQRVAEHRARRPGHWSTVETADIATQLRQSSDVTTLVDDLGGWLTAALDHRGWAAGSVSADVDDLVAAVASFGSPLVLVSPEAGLTVVPATESGRRFADELGTLNQRLAAVCDRVVLVVAGHPLPIKAG
ncbi:bifunctional adenosylcobinamide kinase/adenosylcobinamide-phosphate guanylyltransferase [Mycobacterium sp.]|uniref:bifunctional adenosylcobinamide kinase/adenosylcobinamide-phosphate guanylyltransferase n=1 Tax=Mycobacterium sp. TaxID=1785 RepID=UPI0031D5F0C8